MAEAMLVLLWVSNILLHQPKGIVLVHRRAPEVSTSHDTVEIDASLQSSQYQLFFKCLLGIASCIQMCLSDISLYFPPGAGRSRDIEAVVRTAVLPEHLSIIAPSAKGVRVWNTAWYYVKMSSVLERLLWSVSCAGSSPHSVADRLRAGSSFDQLAISTEHVEG